MFKVHEQMTRFNFNYSSLELLIIKNKNVIIIVRYELC